MVSRELFPSLLTLFKKRKKNRKTNKDLTGGRYQLTAPLFTYENGGWVVFLINLGLLGGPLR